jgi:hypothetical protein
MISRQRKEEASGDRYLEGKEMKSREGLVTFSRQESYPASDLFSQKGLQNACRAHHTRHFGNLI